MTKEMLERMMGLTGKTEIDGLKENASQIMIDLLDEGFEMGDIQYILSVILKEAENDLEDPNKNHPGSEFAGEDNYDEDEDQN